MVLHQYHTVTEAHPYMSPATVAEPAEASMTTCIVHSRYSKPGKADQPDDDWRQPDTEATLTCRCYGRWRWGWWRGGSAGIRRYWDLTDGWLNRAACVGVGPGVPCGRRGVVVGAAPGADMRPAGGIPNEVAIGLGGGAHKACVGGGALQGGVCVVPPAQQCSVHE
jgi:hypothetical protein